MTRRDERPIASRFGVIRVIDHDLTQVDLQRLFGFIIEGELASSMGDLEIAVVRHQREDDYY